MKRHTVTSSTEGFFRQMLSYAVSCCREFTAFFCDPDGNDKAIDITDDLGLMLFDQIITEDPKGKILYKHHDSKGHDIKRGNAVPKFFSARLEHGVLKVPAELYDKGGM